MKGKENKKKRSDVASSNFCCIHWCDSLLFPVDIHLLLHEPYFPRCNVMPRVFAQFHVRRKKKCRSYCQVISPLDAIDPSIQRSFSRITSTPTTNFILNYLIFNSEHGSRSTITKHEVCRLPSTSKVMTPYFHFKISSKRNFTIAK